MTPGASWQSHSKCLTHSRKRTRLAGVHTTTDFQQILRGVSPRVTAARVTASSAAHDHPHTDTDSLVRATGPRPASTSGRTVHDGPTHAPPRGGPVHPTGPATRYRARGSDRHQPRHISALHISALRVDHPCRPHGRAGFSARLRPTTRVARSRKPRSPTRVCVPIARQHTLFDRKPHHPPRKECRDIR